MRRRSRCTDTLNPTCTLPPTWPTPPTVPTCTQGTTHRPTTTPYPNSSSPSTQPSKKKTAAITKWSRTGTRTSRTTLLLIRTVRRAWLKMGLSLWCRCMELMTRGCGGSWRLCPRRIRILWLAGLWYGWIMVPLLPCTAKLRISSGTKSRNQTSRYPQG